MSNGMLATATLEEALFVATDVDHLCFRSRELPKLFTFLSLKRLVLYTLVDLVVVVVAVVVVQAEDWADALLFTSLYLELISVVLVGLLGDLTTELLLLMLLLLLLLLLVVVTTKECLLGGIWLLFVTILAVVGSCGGRVDAVGTGGDDRSGAASAVLMTDADDVDAPIWRHLASISSSLRDSLSSA